MFTSTVDERARASVVCRDHQVYAPSDALLARGRHVAAVFARAGIEATVRAVPGAVSGPEHYHLDAAPWLVEATLALDDVAWWRDATADGAAAGAVARAVDRVAHLCWGVAAAAGRLRTPVGSLRLVDGGSPLRLELGFDLHGHEVEAIVVAGLRSGARAG